MELNYISAGSALSSNCLEDCSREAEDEEEAKNQKAGPVYGFNAKSPRFMCCCRKIHILVRFFCSVGGEMK